MVKSLCLSPMIAMDGLSALHAGIDGVWQQKSSPCGTIQLVETVAI
ncbi:hypothetical protein ACJROX_13125 [Pseudalkalibacillus sp. A8]